jgi:predicted CXXCH cytochrome family protein
MSKTKKKSKRRRNRLIFSPVMKIILVGLGVVALFSAGGFTFAATQEQHDSFCASCHTQPESTFYQRSTDPQPVDLAAVHKTKQVRCIDCHSGHGVAGRVQAELLGAHNALAFFSGTAVQPAKLTRPIGDDKCLKCHQNAMIAQDMNNHFHALLSSWQAADPNAASCVSCHSGHHSDGDKQIMFLNQAQTTQVCNSCHQVLGE